MLSNFNLSLSLFVNSFIFLQPACSLLPWVSAGTWTTYLFHCKMKLSFVCIFFSKVVLYALHQRCLFI